MVAVGVQLFFMISGFVIFLTLERIRQPMDLLFLEYQDYSLHIGLQYNYYRYCMEFWSNGEERSIFTTLANFTMIQGIFEIPDVDGVYWTLLYELIFYVLMFCFFKWGNLKKIHLFIMLEFH